MKRDELLKSKEYWLAQIQNDLYGVVESYMKEKKLNRTKLAQKLQVSKGYVTQLFNGDFDHKLSKLVELTLASGKVPLLCFVDTESFIREDKNGKIFEMIPMVRGKEITYQAMSFKLNAPFKADDKTNDTSPSKVNDNRNSYSMNF